MSSIHSQKRLAWVVSRAEEPDHWHEEITTARRDFNRLARSVGLPQLDFNHYCERLVDHCDVLTLPKLQQLNHMLTHQQKLGEYLRSLIEAREEFVTTMQRETCALNARIPCSVEQHKRLSAALRTLDDRTDAVVEAVVQWHRRLSRPMPYIYKGENILLRIARQNEPNDEISKAARHMRSTSRLSPYYYSSAYTCDSTAMNAEKNWVKRKESLANTQRVAAEPEAQERLLEEMLQMARMGLYIPVLKFYLTARRSITINIPNLTWKKRLCSYYLTALRKFVTKQVAETGNGGMAVADYAALTERSLHMRYLRKWIGWVYKKQQRHDALQQLNVLSRANLCRLRFNTWRTRTGMRLALIQKANHLRARVDNHVRKLYIQKLYMYRALNKTARRIRRATYGHYFYSLLLLTVTKRARAQRKGIRNLVLMALPQYGMRPHLAAVLRADLVQKPAYLLGQDERDIRLGLEQSAHNGVRAMAAECLLEHFKMAMQAELRASPARGVTANTFLLSHAENEEAAQRKAIAGIAALGTREVVARWSVEGLETCQRTEAVARWALVYTGTLHHETLLEMSVMQVYCAIVWRNLRHEEATQWKGLEQARRRARRQLMVGPVDVLEVKARLLLALRCYTAWQRYVHAQQREMCALALEQQNMALLVHRYHTTWAAFVAARAAPDP